MRSELGQQLPIRLLYPMLTTAGAFFARSLFARPDGIQVRDTLPANGWPYFHPLYWRATDLQRYGRYIEELTEFSASLLHEPIAL